VLNHLKHGELHLAYTSSNLSASRKPRKSQLAPDHSLNSGAAVCVFTTMHFPTNPPDGVRDKAQVDGAGNGQSEHETPALPTQQSSDAETQPSHVAPTSINSDQSHEQLCSVSPPSDTSHQVTFDISSYDNLQHQAYHLSASAGYAFGATQQTAATKEAPNQMPGQHQQPLQQQVYYYPSQTPGQASGVVLPPQGQNVYVVPAPLVPIAPNQVQAQQLFQMQGAPRTAQTYVPQQGLAPLTSSFAPHTAASISTTDSSQDIGSKRSLSDLTNSEPLSKKQLVAYPGSQGTTTFAPQNVPSASSTGFEFDDEIDPIHRPPPANYATMSAEEKRRYERNLREQQRSFKITQQIKELRDVLAESCIPFKPNKFSILMSVVDYVKQLQSRAIMLDAEHRKLIDTIRQTSELVNSGQTPLPDDTVSNDNQRAREVGNDSEMLFVQGLDYQTVFNQCPAALGVAALDGRMLACNDEFAVVAGVSREQLLRQSLFNLMNNHEDVFRAMGEMLSAGMLDQQPTKQDETARPSLYWSGVVKQKSQNVSSIQHLFYSLSHSA
jgi:PAS domain-containing protein